MSPFSAHLPPFTVATYYTHFASGFVTYLSVRSYQQLLLKTENGRAILSISYILVTLLTGVIISSTNSLLNDNRLEKRCRITWEISAFLRMMVPTIMTAGIKQN